MTRPDGTYIRNGVEHPGQGAMTSVSHNYCDIMDGPIYETLPPDNKWYKLIAELIPDEDSLLGEIGAGAGIPIVKDSAAGRHMSIIRGGNACIIERSRAYLRIRISAETVHGNGTGEIRKTISDGWRKLGESILQRNPDAVGMYARASSIGRAYVGTHRIFIADVEDELGILGACYYFALEAGDSLVTEESIR